MRGPAALLAFALAIAAPAVALAQEAPPVMAEAPLGSAVIGSDEAARLFREICVETVPDFSAAVARLARLPVAQDEESGIFYHSGFDLSFKLTEAEDGPICSMVMGLDSDPYPLIRTLQALGQAGKVGITTTQPSLSNDRFYFGAFASPL